MKPLRSNTLAALALAAALSGSVGCGADDVVTPPCRDWDCIQQVDGPILLADFKLKDGFYTAPFPNEARRQADGRVDFTDFPNPTNAGIVNSIINILAEDADGFGVSSAIYFAADSAIADDGPIVDVFESVTDDAEAFLLNVEPKSARYLERIPVDVEFRADGGPFGAANLLSIYPLQGRPMESHARHVAVVLRSAGLREDLGVSRSVVAIKAGVKPPGMSERAFKMHRDALAILRETGVRSRDIAAFTSFRTGNPTSGMVQARAAALARPTPQLTTPFTRTQVYDRYCVYEGELPMPVYQSGMPPFEMAGGNWIFKNDEPVLQGEELSRIIVTVPRQTMPDAGFPVVLFSRTGGGGDRPLVDRGVRSENGGEPVELGTGPAQEFAAVGFAGVSVDGPHGGRRNVTGRDEQFLMFNVSNFVAMRDNVRQSALELIVQAHLLKTLTLDASDCPGFAADGDAKFDAKHRVLMGHSMGATIAPITAGIDPSFDAMILSGAGGSWAENIVHKLKPVPVRGLAEVLLGVSGEWRLHTHDPVLAMLQWAGEPADPPVYTDRILTNPTPEGTPTHVLMLQGIVDRYIMPPIANATSLSLELDLAGKALDATHPELTEFRPLLPLLKFGRGRSIDLPARGNYENPAGDKFTAVVVQHAEGPIEDGHEVVFQTAPPKAQYRCFLKTLAVGVPTVPATGGDCPE